MDVLLATSAALPGLHSDDRPLLAALRRAGLTATPAVWEDPYRDWGAARLCVIRSVWDYAYRRDAFVAWARETARVTRLWNSASIVAWNTHKRYLCDLAERGVPVVPTLVLPAGSPVSLRKILSTRGWDRAVLKGAVAQAGRYALRVDPPSVGRGQAHLDRLLPREEMLVQPYLGAVEETGELSLVWVDGAWTHAVRKRAAPGEYLVHDDYGGSVTREEPEEDELAAAERALGAVDEPLRYARVDLVRDDAGSPVVMELELVEPELFFRFSPESVERFVAAVAAAVRGDA